MTKVSYNKNGCYRKKTNEGRLRATFIMTKRRRKTKAEKTAIFEKSQFSSIKDSASLTVYLRSNANPYNDLMLDFIHRKNNGVNILDEVHHIIPTAEGGPNDFWNLVPVTFAEHCLAHKLRFEAYGKHGDYIASISREDTPASAKEIKTMTSKLGHAKMKEKNIGFYNSDSQRELGKRSGGRKTEGREKGYLNQVSEKSNAILSKELIFENILLKITEKTAANQFKRTGQIKDFLVALMPEGTPTRELILNDKYFTTNLNKVLSSIVNPTALSRKTYKGWTVIENI